MYLNNKIKLHFGQVVSKFGNIPWLCKDYLNTHAYLGENKYIAQSSLTYCHCGLVGNTSAQEHRGCLFDPRYRQIHSGSDDHLKWWSPVIGYYPSSWLKNLKDVNKWSSLCLYLSVSHVSTLRVGLYLYSRMGHIVL